MTRRPDSPIGRVWERDGQVLLLGVDHTADSTVHLGECLAGVPYRRAKWATILSAGDPLRFLCVPAAGCDQCDDARRSVPA